MMVTMDSNPPKNGDEPSARALVQKLRTCTLEELEELAAEHFGFCDLSFNILRLIVREVTPDSEWANSLDRLLEVIQRLLPAKMLKEEERFQGTPPEAGSALRKRMAPRRQLALLTRAWMRLMSFRLPADLLMRALLVLGDGEISRLRNPQLLADVVMNALDLDGDLGLASLRAVFHLILEHNVEYPNIYDRIYALLGQPNLLRSPIKVRFLKDVDVFLTSLHIPTVTLAAFAKRLAGLALRADAPDARLLLLLLSNIMRRHPTALCLLHRDEEAAEAAEQRYDPRATSPAASGALTCSLHELNALAAHWDPEVAAAAAALLAKPPEVRVMEKDPEREGRAAHEANSQRISSALRLLRSLRGSNARLPNEALTKAKRARPCVPAFPDS